PFHQAESALDQLGLRGEAWSGKLSGLKPRRLPAILKLEGDGAAVLLEEREGERPWQRAARAHWFWSEVWKVRRAFLYVALAAGVINMLAVALPLFTMNVYDR